MKELIKSLIEFKKSCPVITKDATNPHFRNDYATLDSIIGTIQPILTKNGLTVVQPIVWGNAGATTLKTIVFHESGESLEGEMVLPSGLTPQQLGSCITYYRRYSLLSILGLSTGEDDDANVTAPVNKPQIPQPQKFEAPSTAQLKYLLELATRAKTPIENADKLSKQQAKDMIDKLLRGTK